jgi:hypothetical protein
LSNGRPAAPADARKVERVDPRTRRIVTLLVLAILVVAVVAGAILR